MIAAVYTQGGQFRITDHPKPTISPRELLVRVDATAICGTDVKIIRHGHRKLYSGQTLVLGHEFVGTIEQVGGELDGFQVGRRVAVAPNFGCGRCDMCSRGLSNMCPDYLAFGIGRDGSHAPWVAIPEIAIAQGNVLPLAESVDPVAACLAEPLSCVVHAQRATGIEPGDWVVVYGAGPMGLLNMMLASVSGAARVVAIDLQDDRLEKAAELGATDRINPSRENTIERTEQLTGGRGVDVVVIAVPVPQLQSEAMRILAPLGRLCLFAGWPKGTDGVNIDTNPIHYKSLRVVGTTGGPVRDLRAALELIAGGRIDVRRVISNVFPMDRMREAYDAALAGDRMKIVITGSAS